MPPKDKRYVQRSARLHKNIVDVKIVLKRFQISSFVARPYCKRVQAPLRQRYGKCKGKDSRRSTLRRTHGVPCSPRSASPQRGTADARLSISGGPGHSDRLPGAEEASDRDRGLGRHNVWFSQAVHRSVRSVGGNRRSNDIIVIVDESTPRCVLDEL